MRVLLLCMLVVLPGGIAGCATPEQNAAYTAYIEGQCERGGYERGTLAWAGCRQALHEQTGAQRRAGVPVPSMPRQAQCVTLGGVTRCY